MPDQGHVVDALPHGFKPPGEAMQVYGTAHAHLPGGRNSGGGHTPVDEQVHHQGHHDGSGQTIGKDLEGCTPQSAFQSGQGAIAQPSPGQPAPAGGRAQG